MKSLLLIIAAAVLLPSCYSTHLAGRWQSPQPSPTVFKKILVLGMMPDSAMRQRMEAHVAGDLTDAGIIAVTSYQAFDAFAYLQTEDKIVTKQFTDKGIDGVLTISLLSKTTEGFLLPGSLYRLLTDQYATDYFRMYAPEFHRKTTHFTWESSLYNVATGSRTFAIQTVSFDPSSLERMAHEYGKVVSRELLRRKAISRR